MQITGIAGWLSDRFPVGWVMVGGYVLWSGATVITGLVSRPTTIYIALLLLGVGESVAYPATRASSPSFPRNIVAEPCTDRRRHETGSDHWPVRRRLLLVHFGWRMLFILLGGGGLLWLPPWIKAMPRFGRRVEVESAAGLSSM